jgi:hypothetical protein
MYKSPLLLLCAMIGLIGCSNSRTTSGASWDSYDYRGVTPDANAYQGNDDNYVAPQSYGCTLDAGQVCE